MKTSISLASAAVALAFTTATFAATVGGKREAKVPAFPGAEGAGAITPGGRGGKVFEVTTLADGGPGSLREACEATMPRMVVFRVAGIITLTNRLTITHPFITIAGQSAPGDGVCVRGETTEVNTHDAIIRYMRFRRGDLKRRDDCLGGNPVGRVIVDHCSCSWGLDENLSMYRQMGKTLAGEDQKLPSERITIQWTISSEALDLNNHAFGGTWGGRYSSFHHNLFASNTGRNPSIGWGDHIDYRNNVIFNWRHRTMDGGDNSSTVNVVNNYYKPGPAANEGSVRHRICMPQHADMLSEAPVPGRWFVEGNVVEGFPEVTRDNWNGGVQSEGVVKGQTFNATTVEAEIKAFIERKRSLTPIPAVPVLTQTAQEAFEVVLAHAGATLPRRDVVDLRIIESVRAGKTTVGKNGIVNTPDEAGGYPEYKFTTAPVDTDHDGIPDEWEIKFGLNPNDPSDGAKPTRCGDGYTNLEAFLNGTDPTVFVDYTKPENNRDPRLPRP